MFSAPQIFSDTPGLVSYFWDKTLPMRPRQFHDEFSEYREWKNIIQETFWVEHTFFMAQYQSSEILEVTETNLWEICYVDSCYTRLTNITLNVVVADCVPILLYDSKKKIVWAVHAGWRGSSEKILKKTLEALKEKFWSEMKDIIMHIWPSICENCYEVGREVAELFDDHVVSQSHSKYFLDLRAENLIQALESWVPRENIEISEECTFELPEKYFSYRREKLKANFVCGIGMREVWK